MKIYTVIRNSRKEVVSKTFEEATPIRVQVKRKLMPSASGSPVVSTALIFFELDTPISRTSLIDLYGDGGLYEVLQFYPVQDVDGNPHHIEVTV